AIERAALEIGFETLPGEAVLHRHGDGATEGVEAENRIAGDDRRLVDRICWDEVPVDRVAERLVDAGAVLVDGQPLRRASDRGRVETTIEEVWLELVAGDVA